MGFFGGQTRQDPVGVPSYEDETFEDAFDALPSLPKPQDNTVIAKGITFTGTIEGEGIVQIEGRLEGEIKLKGSVTITTTGEVKGPIAADSVRVAGEVMGSITARDHLCLERTGSIHGDVSTCSLVVENGRLDGSSKMLAPPERPREVQPPEATVSGMDFDIPLDEE